MVKMRHCTSPFKVSTPVSKSSKRSARSPVMYGHGGLSQGASGRGGLSDHIALINACKIVRWVTDIQEVHTGSQAHIERTQRSR